MRVVLASRNEGKLAEFRVLLGSRFDLVPLPADVELPPETGTTYRENALLKAEAAARATGLPALADDSGLEVEAIGGRPGVRSARFASEHATDAENIALLLSMLADVPEDRRRATFIAVLCLFRPGEAPVFVEGRVAGRITTAARGDAGFGYDPVFLHTGTGLTFAEMAPGMKNALSHRAKAARALVQLVHGLPGSEGE